MKKFVFRLEAVLRHRKTIEEIFEQHFAKAQGEFLILQTGLTGFQSEFNRVVSERPGRDGEHFDAHIIFDRERYLETLQSAIDQQERRVATAKILVEEARERLLVARQAREAVSQLRDKELALYTATALKAEQAELDELATLRHVRQQIHSNSSLAGEKAGARGKRTAVSRYESEIDVSTTRKAA